MIHGHEVIGCPEDLQVIAILHDFPGYTRKTLLEEPAAFVARLQQFRTIAHHAKESS